MFNIENFKIPKAPEFADAESKKYWNKIFISAWESILNPGKPKKELPKAVSKNGNFLYVFRHGQTFDNKKRIFSGWRNSKLTKEGLKQAELLAEKLRGEKIDLCINSPLLRSIETAQIALKNHPAVKFESDQRIIERNYGILQGTSKIKAMKRFLLKAVLYRRGYDFAPPRGESLKQVEERVFPFCIKIAERVKKEKINIAISCHGNSMKAIRRYFEKLPIEEELTMENPLGQDFAKYQIQ